MRKEESEKRKFYNSYYESKIEIDCVVFRFEEKSLKVLLVKKENDFGNVEWRLPNCTMEQGDTIGTTAQKVLKKYISEDNFFLDQLKAFDYNTALSSKEKISIGYYAMVCKKAMDDQESNSDIMWIDVRNTTCLEEKYKMILDFSMIELKKNICCSAVGFNLLPEKFTLLQVFNLYEEILGVTINKTNFRRKILQRKLVRGLDEKERGVSNRAAEFYILTVPKDEIFWNAKFNFNF